MSQPAFPTIADAAAALRAKKVSAVELTRDCLARIEKLNGRVNAFITVTGEQALREAEAADRKLASGAAGPLTGIPIAHKDIIYTKGIRTTSGSKVFTDFVPDFDAPLVETLRAAGAVMVGKTGLHELAYGITSNNPHFGAVRNPWDLERIPGGSSGGSAAAVMTGMCLMAMGSDTGGSIRIPASFCGLSGIKPTYGKISRHGVTPLAFSLDHLGPMARTVRDTAVCYEALVGEPHKPIAAGGRLDGVRIGVPRSEYFSIIEPGVDAALRRALQLAVELGAKVEEVAVPNLEEMNAVALLIQLPEAASANAGHIEKRDLLGPDVWVLLNQGRLVPAVDYVNAQRLRRRMQVEFGKVFRKVDCLLMPSTCNTAPKIGQATVSVNGVERDTRLLTTRCARSINMLGLPALAMPCGKDGAGLPVGMQLVGRKDAEGLLFRVGAAVEDAMSPGVGWPALAGAV